MSGRNGPGGPTLVIVAPHFGHPGHLGAVRTERFQRWASDSGMPVVVVRAGSRNDEEETGWGRVVTLCDPLGLYRDPPGAKAVPPKPRRSSRVRRTAAYLLMVPDPVVAWAWRVLQSRAVRMALPGSGWILSSSPPESCHLAASRLACWAGLPHIVDLRDGWLDEPMIPLLSASRLQRLRHGRIERRILNAAAAVLVTSNEWKRQLIERRPHVRDRVHVITNSYPENFPEIDTGRCDTARMLRLVYAGKVESSRPERSIRDLLIPLAAGCRRSGGRGVVEFVGNLTEHERSGIMTFDPVLAELGWNLVVRPPRPRNELFDLLVDADGLLLLSASRASIPAKIFDYIPSGRPILAVAPAASAVAEVADRTPQVFLHGIESAAERTVDEFLAACRQRVSWRERPTQYGEGSVKKLFMSLLETL